METNRSRINQQTLAKQFVHLYYGVLNTHHEYLYQFYGKNSTVTVSETMDEGGTLVETAEDETAFRELLSSLYTDVTIRVSSVVPQSSVENSVMLHVNGTMEKKSTENRRLFTQVFLLFPQENGYYIQTDVAHVMGPASQTTTDASVETESPVEGSNSTIGANPLRLGTFTGEVPNDSGMVHSTVQELRTNTPPLEDTAHVHEPEQETAPQTSHHKPSPWIIRPPIGGSSVSHNILPHPMPVPGTIPMPMSHAGVNGMMYPMPMPSRFLHQRSASLGCDPWTAQRAATHGVFIARLPFGIQPADVEAAFTPFGAIQGGREGIQVRDGRNGCYAFITFEDPESAQAAIQQGAIIEGKRVFVEPRYPRQDTETRFVAFSPMMPPGPLPTYHMAPVNLPRMPR
eukprot:g7663.t1